MSRIGWAERDKYNSHTDARECIRSGQSAVACNLAISGVHHDKVQKKYTTVTVIAYLNDISGGGGGTVFPCVTKYSGSSKTPTSKICTDVYKLNGRWFDGQKAVIEGAYAKQPISGKFRTDFEDLLLASHFGCLEQMEQPSGIYQPALKTVAKKGSAVVFFSDNIDQSADDQAWHGGCLQHSGDKWTLQKFKELPIGMYRKSYDLKNEKKTEEIRQNLDL